jgi:hypothetical protein
MTNDLRIAASNFRNAMRAVSAARDQLAQAVAAEDADPNAHERDRETRDALGQLRNRLRGGELPEILGATKMVPELDVAPVVVAKTEGAKK